MGRVRVKGERGASRGLADWGQDARCKSVCRAQAGGGNRDDLCPQPSNAKALSPNHRKGPSQARTGGAATFPVAVLVGASTAAGCAAELAPPSAASSSSLSLSGSFRAAGAGGSGVSCTTTRCTSASGANEWRCQRSERRRHCDGGRVGHTSGWVHGARHLFVAVLIVAEIHAQIFGVESTRLGRSNRVCGQPGTNPLEFSKGGHHVTKSGELLFPDFGQEIQKLSKLTFAC